MTKKKPLSLLALTLALMFSSQTTQADPVATSSSSSSTSGYNLDLRLAVGGVAVRPYEADVSLARGQSSAYGQIASIEGAVRVPLQIDQYDYPGLSAGPMLDPRIQLRIDTAQGQVRNINLDVGGLSAMRVHGMETHLSPAMKNRRFSSRKRVVQAMLDHIQSLRIQPRPGSEIAYAGDASLDWVFNLYGSLKDKLKSLLRKENIVGRHGDVYTIGDDIWKLVEALDRHLREHPKSGEEGGDLAEAVRTKIVDATFDRSENIQDEAHLTGEFRFITPQFHHSSNAALDTRQTGVRLSVADGSIQSALRINETVNVGICGAIKPLEILIGESRGVGRLSSSAEGCLDLTVGELPTIRNRSSVTRAWHYTDDSVESNASYRFVNSLTLEKDLGGIRPYAGYDYEIEHADLSGTTVTTHLFKVGVAN